MKVSFFAFVHGDSAPFRLAKKARQLQKEIEFPNNIDIASV